MINSGTNIKVPEGENLILSDASGFDAGSIRRDFPILNTTVHGKPLVYLDNAATTHKPIVVIEKTREYYEETNSNIHRGVHFLSQKATNEYEDVREKVRAFINARSHKEIVFTKGATESINLVASTFGRMNIGAGDEIIISYMEHHSNIVPWQMLTQEKGAVLKVVPINDKGELEMDKLPEMISEKTKLISIVHVSNSLGTINPVKEIIELAHTKGIPVLVDGSQSIQHLKIDVRDLDCDFFVFSGHKIYGPTGTGILYGKEELLDAMPPYQGGGDMIAAVSFEKTLYNELPFKFEAGTPNIAGMIGLGTAIDYVNGIGIEKISAYEKYLSDYAASHFVGIPKFRPIGNAKNKVSVFSFILAGIHPHDIGTILDFEGIAIRTGHHCTQPVMKRFNIPATARVSIAMYNTKEEIDHFVSAINKVFEVFA